MNGTSNEEAFDKYFELFDMYLKNEMKRKYVLGVGINMDMKWKDKYNKKTKPAYNELLDFFAPHIRELFLKFDHEMQEQFKVSNKYHRYQPSVGWVYGYGRGYSVELLTVIINDGCFDVLGVSVNDEFMLLKALNEAKKMYESGFEERYATVCEKRRADQIERSKKRVAREKIEIDKLAENIDPDKFNKFKWHKKVSRSDLYRLYQGEARGLIDEVLLEDIASHFICGVNKRKKYGRTWKMGKLYAIIAVLF